MLRKLVPSLATTFRRAATKAEIVNSSDASQIGSQIASEVSDSSKRLFAVVYLNGRQWKISQGDLIALEGELPLNVGDVLNLEKVLMVGSQNFSIFGRPFLDRASTNVKATVVEKNTKSPEVFYFHNNHQQAKQLHWLTCETTVLRINEVTVDKKITGPTE